MDETLVATRPVRAGWRGLLAALLLLLTLAGPSAVLAQDEEDDELPLALSEVPSFGGLRPGPINPTAAARTPVSVPEGVAPVQIQMDISGFLVNAPIEIADIDESGAMIDPSGPWVVAWYDDLSALGERNNVVMAGHVDYYTTGAAVFYGFKDPGVQEGQAIRVIAEDGEIFDYEVEWTKLYNVADDLTPEVIQTEIVGETDEESLTLITCGGEFNYDTGEYLERQVVRAVRV